MGGESGREREVGGRESEKLGGPPERKVVYRAVGSKFGLVRRGKGLRYRCRARSAPSRGVWGQPPGKF